MLNTQIYVREPIAMPCTKLDPVLSVSVSELKLIHMYTSIQKFVVSRRPFTVLTVFLIA